MAEIDVLKAQIVRQDLSVPWGFRLQGGVDQGEPLHINRLTPGSPAARIGLKAGDEVTEIGDLSTEGLTHQQAIGLIAQYGDTVVLTVERRAKGVIPSNPVLGTEGDPLKNYQTYDMSGAKPAPRPAHTYTQVIPAPGGAADNNHVVTAGPIIFAGTTPKPEPRQDPKFYQTYDLNGPKAPVASAPKHDYQFQTVRARPFVDSPKPNFSPRTSMQPESHQTPPLSPVHQQYSPPPMSQEQYSPYNYSTPEYSDKEDGGSQSRTFRVLQSLMSSDEPAAGVQGLPPPRSLSQEQWKADQAAKRANPRVKVFMPQQYNSPLGMYSAKNVVETFQAQAGTMMDAMGSRQGMNNGQLSDVQRAVMET